MYHPPSTTHSRWNRSSKPEWCYSEKADPGRVSPELQPSSSTQSQQFRLEPRCLMSCRCTLLAGQHLPQHPDTHWLEEPSGSVTALESGCALPCCKRRTSCARISRNRLGLRR